MAGTRDRLRSSRHPHPGAEAAGALSSRLTLIPCGAASGGGDTLSPGPLPSMSSPWLAAWGPLGVPGGSEGEGEGPNLEPLHPGGVAPKGDRD